VGTARQAADLLAALCFCVLRLMQAASHGPLVCPPRRFTARSPHPPRYRHLSQRRQDLPLSTG
jgi:hypothetical protein